MPADATTDPEFAIGHVLFIDIVGYSKLLIGEQSELVRQLKEVVAGSDQVRLAEKKDKLVSLPTGDGVVLVFRNGAEAPAQCAVEIARAVSNYPELHLRMGIHSGPVNMVTDINNRANMAGAGINIAQRVMNCGDAGHILLSKHGAEDLEAYARWRPYLHDLGECDVKHGARISLVNLCGDDFGNAEVPEKLEGAKREQARISRSRRKRVLLATSILAVAAFGIGYWIFHQNRATDLIAIPEKSIAVLPFENRSTEKENAFFADGVQDEILTDLARIADLKVISRTSVMQYKAGIARNAHAIGQALGVANLLEGSVQRAGGKVRVNAQLIDARTDTHLWAQTYDRDLADIFAIQSEIAKTIADQLQAKLSPREKAEIERPPTSDNVAFDLYSRAKMLSATAHLVGAQQSDFLHAIDLLDQAIARDPNFFLAYCELAYTHGQMYFFNVDRTPARCALVNSAVQKATLLRPEAGEAHLARAGYLYRCFQNYNGARAELAIAARTLPNNSEVFTLLGYIDRRQSRWEDSRRNLEKALLLDPRNFGLLQQIGATYDFLRDYAAEAAAYDRAIELAPDDTLSRLARAYVEVAWHADLRLLRDAVHSTLSKNPKATEDIASDWFGLAFLERDATEARRAFAFIPADGININAMAFPRAWYNALAARLGGDEPAAREAFAQARSEVELLVRKQPDYGPPLCILGLIDAALGRKEDAIKEGRRAVELLPLEKDSINGSHLLTYLAMIYTWAGEKDLAIAQLNANFSKPGDGSYGDLRLQPFWDSLRGDWRFEKLVASSAPKD